MHTSFQTSLDQRGIAVASAIALPEDGGVPEWVMIFPAGTSMGVDGRGPYRNINPEKVISTSYKDGRPVPFDYNHQTVFAVQNGGEARASGWMPEMQVRDGAIWAKVDWTKAASDAIAAKEYRFVSPTFKRDLKTGEVLCIDSVGLVNTPNLTELPAIASKTGVDQMEKLLSALRDALGLPADADQDAIIAACKSSRATASAMVPLANTLKLAPTATAVEVVTAAQAAISTVTATPNPALYVPMAAFTDLQTQVATLLANQSASQTETVVASAMQEGKVSPAMKEWALSYAAKDLTGFVEWASKTPVIIKPQTSASQFSAAPPGTLSTSDDGVVREICSNLGITVEAYRKTQETMAKETA